MPNVITTQTVMLAEVGAGLARRQKELPSKYFYDFRGSQLFEQITQLPEYYLTRAERRLLIEWMPSLMRARRPDALVELGAGSGEKTRIILKAIRAAGGMPRYIPIDVSAEFLDSSAARLRGELPWLPVAPLVADFTADVPLTVERDSRETVVFALLGSTIGNFSVDETIQLLRRVRAAMHPRDRFLLGADLFTKPVSRIEAAYNDAAGVTAEFNRNILHVLNRELGADFDPDAFEHRAPWVPDAHRIEMHLVATQRHVVRVPGLPLLVLEPGESIRTEICGKYDRTVLERLFTAASLEIETWRVDALDQYAVLIAAPRGANA